MSIFDTTAPTDFNAFGNPLNPVNMNTGNWGMNSSYLTPAYTAPYRPPYSGGQPHVANQSPGFFSSAYGLSPFNWSGSPYGVGSNAQDQSYWDSIGSRPMDFGAAFGQRVATPLLAYGAAFSWANKWKVGNTNSAIHNWKSIFGGANAASQVSGFTGMGARFGEGAARGIIGGAASFAGRSGMAGSAFARGAISAAGALGGAAAFIGMPAMLAQGAISAADNMVFDNYIGVRENSNMLRGSFGGVSFGGNYGDPFTGGGLSRRSAGQMGGELTQAGAKDQVFNAREVATMGNMAAQMGLMDNVSAGQITSKLKSLVQQIKIVMSVAGTTDFKEAMNMMARLQMAGVSPGSLSSTVAGIGSFASQAGISTTRMFNTVGAQGQYLFQANGLTPYLGQISAASSMAGFSSAFRSGLISPDLMARMGGVEGASQSSLTGQLNAAQTTYNMMRGFNRYTTGAGGSGVISNITNFGRTFAGNPMAAYGALMRTGKANVSNLFRDEGVLGAYNQMRELADINPITANRSLSQDEMMTLAIQMGMSPEQAQGYLAELGTYQDPKTMRQRASGGRTARINMMRDYLEQTEQTWFKSSAPIAGTLRGIRGVRSGIAGMMGTFQAGTGGIVDSLSAGWTSATVGTPESLAGMRMSDVSASAGIPSMEFRARTKENAGYNRNLSEHQNDISKIISAAKSGDETAIRALKGDANAIYTMAREGIISRKYTTSENAASLTSTMLSLPSRVEQQADEFGRLEGALEESMFTGSTLEKAKGYRLAWRMQEKLEKNKDAFDNPDEEMLAMMGEFGQRSGQSDVLGIRRQMDKAIGEAHDKGISLSNRYEDASPDDTLKSFGTRTNMKLESAIGNINSNVSLQQKINLHKSREQQDRQDQMQDNTVKKLMSEGRVDLAAGYKMLGAADKWGVVADKWDKVADRILQGKEVTVGNDRPKASDVGTMRQYTTIGSKK